MRLSLLLSLGLLPWGSVAIYKDSGVDAEECQWANVVHVGSTCTGTYLGDDVVVTAAHCDAPGSVRFAEYGKGSFDDGSFKVNVKEDDQGQRMCVRHPDFVSNGDKGPDIMYCILDEEDENHGKLDDVPIVRPMMPTGCERDWLRNQVYNVYRCPGVGSTKWSCHDKGPQVVGVGVGCANAAIQGSTGCSLDDRKRISVPKFRLVRQENHNDDPTSLYVYDSEEGSGIMSGDSGGPLFVELPDSTWRQIGVVHSSGIGANYAALPNRLRWIENSSGKDITPLHTWQSGSYQYLGSCSNTHPLKPHDPPNGAQWDASQGCKTDMPYKQNCFGECGNWGGPFNKISHPPGNGNAHGVLTKQTNTEGDLFDDSFSTFLRQERGCRGPGGGSARLPCEPCRCDEEDEPPREEAGRRGGNRRGGMRALLSVKSNEKPKNVCDMLGNSPNQTVPCNDAPGCVPGRIGI